MIKSSGRPGVDEVSAPRQLASCGSEESALLRKEELRKLKDKILGVKTLPLRESATQLVFGEGNPNADICFIGEAPGRFEDQQGRPFVGQAGKLLDKLLGEIGIRRDDVYITNIVKYRPPNNRPPTPSEIGAFLPYVDEEIGIIDPKLIATLGRFSLAKFMPEGKISKVHGVMQTVRWNGKTLHILPLYHPAAAFRRRAMRQALEEDFRRIPHILSGHWIRNRICDGGSQLGESQD
ncbi:MAG: uracil-DNA glycosylase [Elusimicrobia bacterium]|nr:uracil-DNA glycosylase [Elusimicrobiota bacterium]